MASLKKQSFISLLIMAVTLAGVILAIWWIFISPAEAPNTELQQTESDFEAIEFDEQQINSELDDLEKEIEGLEMDWGR
ncbi:MAG: hypothetical protein A2919_01175 [Candidatus Spechtbacteria bacterium RIFCSPLOWO2_01_FULL_43_12]|uniref:Uncharacterized protein n=1 Tax=Candidatus Spechtbacteria bacterium RIFCSPLOWO2_01_FULL_43_12 TaxID=1802162 RepID=A0A1G2HFV7_9BACT|nr:MAG: hypothetical protein A2919_01175 [Candidatus Spechtbacteria bacterium RIFCSPLOWO2_01_FULL_43_12]